MEEITKAIVTAFNIYKMVFFGFWCVTIPTGITCIVMAFVSKTKFRKMLFPMLAIFFLFFHMKGLKPRSLDGDFDFNSLTYARLRGAWFDDFQSSAPKCANPPTSVGGS